MYPYIVCIVPYDGDIVEIWKEEEKKKIQDRNCK